MTTRHEPEAREAVLDGLWRRVVRDSATHGGSIHGPDHWARVEQNGCYLAEHTGADAWIVRLFALLHDCRRENDGHDPEHGARAAAYAWSIRDQLMLPDHDDLDRLLFACRWHTDRKHDDDATIGVCWDADRLDLGRVGIDPHLKYLNTGPARTIAATGDLSSLRAIPMRELRDISEIG